MGKAVAKSKERGKECDSAKNSDEADKAAAWAKDQFGYEGQKVDFFLLSDLHVGCRTGSERPDDGEHEQRLGEVPIHDIRLILREVSLSIIGSNLSKLT